MSCLCCCCKPSTVRPATPAVPTNAAQGAAPAPAVMDEVSVSRHTVLGSSNEAPKRATRYESSISSAAQNDQEGPGAASPSIQRSHSKSLFTRMNLQGQSNSQETGAYIPRDSQLKAASSHVESNSSLVADHFLVNQRAPEPSRVLSENHLSQSLSYSSGKDTPQEVELSAAPAQVFQAALTRPPTVYRASRSSQINDLPIGPLGNVEPLALTAGKVASKSLPTSDKSAFSPNPQPRKKQLPPLGFSRAAPVDQAMDGPHPFSAEPLLSRGMPSPAADPHLKTPKPTPQLPKSNRNSPALAATREFSLPASREAQVIIDEDEGLPGRSLYFRALAQDTSSAAGSPLPSSASSSTILQILQGKSSPTNTSPASIPAETDVDVSEES